MSAVKRWAPRHPRVSVSAGALAQAEQLVVGGRAELETLVAQAIDRGRIRAEALLAGAPGSFLVDVGSGLFAVVLEVAVTRQGVRWRVVELRKRGRLDRLLRRPPKAARRST